MNGRGRRPRAALDQQQRSSMDAHQPTGATHGLGQGLGDPPLQPSVLGQRRRSLVMSQPDDAMHRQGPGGPGSGAAPPAQPPPRSFALAMAQAAEARQALGQGQGPGAMLDKRPPSLSLPLPQPEAADLQPWSPAEALRAPALAAAEALHALGNGPAAGSGQPRSPLAMPHAADAGQGQGQWPGAAGCRPAAGLVGLSGASFTIMSRPVPAPTPGRKLDKLKGGPSSPTGSPTWSGQKEQQPAALQQGTPAQHALQLQLPPLRIRDPSSAEPSPSTRVPGRTSLELYAQQRTPSSTVAHPAVPSDSGKQVSPGAGGGPQDINALLRVSLGRLQPFSNGVAGNARLRPPPLEEQGATPKKGVRTSLCLDGSNKHKP